MAAHPSRLCHMEHQDLLPHLFRTEFSKLTAVLARLFGIEHIEEAEDIASETFLAAFETWSYKGIPPNPTAWLYAVAKNKARNYIARNQVFRKKISGDLKLSSLAIEEIEINLSEKNITDSQLQMLFTICHPAISTESQIGLALRILCGFGIDEIASAFLVNKETIQKRLFRAKEKLRLEKIQIKFPELADIEKRLESVLKTLYLLFSEGYYSETRDVILREDFCLEAMRLTYLLLENDQTNQPRVNALLALMCFQASRFPARKNENGAIILYEDQQEDCWNQDLIAKGAYYFRLAAQGRVVSTYHLEAGIAYWSTQKKDSKEKWENILQLYNQLLQIEYSPIAALNRTYALARANGNAVAIAEAEKLKLETSHFYFVLLGELYKDLDGPKARVSFEKAYDLAKTNTEKQMISRKIREIKL